MTSLSVFYVLVCTICGTRSAVATILNTHKQIVFVSLGCDFHETQMVNSMIFTSSPRYCRQQLLIVETIILSSGILRKAGTDKEKIDYN